MTRTGLYVGKFYPPHAGHSYVIETALEQVDRLIVMVVEQPEQIPTGVTRKYWLENLHPEARVMTVPDIYNDEDSKAWADYTVQCLGFAPDVVFTSESYGDLYARYLGCEHVLVDIGRKKFPVSARNIRERPLEYWEYLSPQVRGYYAERICVMGAESTGTTTLCQDLAEHFKTAFVPEFGRVYSQGKYPSNRNWRTEEFVEIAQLQNGLEDLLAKESNKVLICDTTSFTTAFWHENFIGHWSDNVEMLSHSRAYLLYIVTDIDIAFTQDGLREGGAKREKMHERMIEELDRCNLDFIIVSGSRKERLDKAICEISKRMQK